jgi:hypothetical protein
LALVDKSDLKFWYKKLEYIGIQRFLQMKSGTTISIDFSPTEITAFECEVCILDNAYKAPIYNKSPEGVSMPEKKLHWDTCGLIKISTLCSKRYIVVAVDIISAPHLFIFVLKSLKPTSVLLIQLLW